MTRKSALLHLFLHEGPLIHGPAKTLIPFSVLPYCSKTRDKFTDRPHGNHAFGGNTGLVWRLWHQITPSGSLTITTYLGYGYSPIVGKIMDNDVVELFYELRSRWNDIVWEPSAVTRNGGA